MLAADWLTDVTDGLLLPDLLYPSVNNPRPGGRRLDSGFN